MLLHFHHTPLSQFEGKNGTFIALWIYDDWRSSGYPVEGSMAKQQTNTLRRNMKRILILIADYGYGHRSAANAIAEALQETYGKDCRVEIVNPMDDPRAPAFLREGENSYDKIVRAAPDLYKVGYEVGDTWVVRGFIKDSLTLMLFNALREIIHNKQPDVIVCTYLFYQEILSALFTLEKHRIPLLTVVTDLATVNKLWFHPVVDLCLVPTQTVHDMAIEAGLPSEKIKITGIPVRPELTKGKQDRTSLRMSLGWRPDLFTVLAIGSKRVEHLYDALKGSESLKTAIAISGCSWGRR